MLRKKSLTSIALLVALLMGLALVSACAAPAGTTESTEEISEASAPASEEGDGETTISWLRLAEWNAASPAIIEAFEASHPGIKVEVEEIPFSELVSQINLRMGAETTRPSMCCPLMYRWSPRTAIEDGSCR
jgi:ABC-type glycerol-3-phosphate transport system substrate-binding protein